MVVRVKLKILVESGLEVLVPALANAGFESDKPEIMEERRRVIIR